MEKLSYSEQPKVVLVTRQTRYQELLIKHRTASNAKFYLNSLGADFNDFAAENAAYNASLQSVTQTLQQWGRYQTIDRQYLPNYVFAEDDIVVVLGQDGTVANTLKYLNGQPLVGVNPEPTRWDGLLLPFRSEDVSAVLLDVYKHRCQLKSVTLAEAVLADGQRMLAVNDFFIGARTHTSALYEISHKDLSESQSSSGVIVSTGLGSTAWMSSVVSGSGAVASAVWGDKADEEVQTVTRLPWDTNHLLFAVREPFKSKNTAANIVFGQIDKGQSLTLRSKMPQNGVIFSDGIESDFIRFDAGVEAQIKVSGHVGNLVGE